VRGLIFLFPGSNTRARSFAGHLPSVEGHKRGIKILRDREKRTMIPRDSCSQGSGMFRQKEREREGERGASWSKSRWTFQESKRP